MISYTRKSFFIRYPNTSKLVKKARLSPRFLTHFSVFGYRIKHYLSCMIFDFIRKFSIPYVKYMFRPFRFHMWNFEPVHFACGFGNSYMKWKFHEWIYLKFHMLFTSEWREIFVRKVTDFTDSWTLVWCPFHWPIRTCLIEHRLLILMVCNRGGICTVMSLQVKRLLNHDVPV